MLLYLVDLEHDGLDEIGVCVGAFGLGHVGEGRQQADTIRAVDLRQPHTKLLLVTRLWWRESERE